MLRITHRQRQGFDQQSRERFVTEMVDHLGPRSPLHLKVLGDEGLRRAIRFGIDRAAARGYTQRGPVRLWLELMLLFGGRFDEDPLVPAEVRPLLTCRDPDRQLPISRDLQAEACLWIRRIAGPGNAHTRQALARVHELVERNWAPRPDDLVEQLLGAIGWAHPHQFELLGAEPHRRLIEGALEQARALGIGTLQGQTLFPVLAFLVGAGFARDPLYPWISATLADAEASNPDERAARLDRRARTYLRHVITNLKIA